MSCLTVDADAQVVAHDGPVSSVRALVVLHPHDAGGRSSSIGLTGRYRPHLQVDGGPPLGVQVVADPAGELEPGGRAEVDLLLLYDVDYSALRAGAQFTIMEGAREVGTGVVLP